MAVNSRWWSEDSPAVRSGTLFLSGPFYCGRTAPPGCPDASDACSTLCPLPRATASDLCSTPHPLMSCYSIKTPTRFRRSRCTASVPSLGLTLMARMPSAVAPTELRDNRCAYGQGPGMLRFAKEELSAVAFNPAHPCTCTPLPSPTHICGFMQFKHFKHPGTLPLSPPLPPGTQIRSSFCYCRTLFDFP